MTIGIDRQIRAEREARDREALFPSLPPQQRAAAERKAAVRESQNLLRLMVRRDPLPHGAERDRLTREINESQAFIERRLAKAAE